MTTIVLRFCHKFTFAKDDMIKTLEKIILMSGEKIRD